MGAMQICFSASMPTVACRPWTIAWKVQMEPSQVSSVNLGMKREASILLCSRLKPESTGMLAVALAIAVPVLTFHRTNATICCYVQLRAVIIQKPCQGLKSNGQGQIVLASLSHLSQCRDGETTEILLPSLSRFFFKYCASVSR